jgi:hypothetical protein
MTQTYIDIVLPAVNDFQMIVNEMLMTILGAEIRPNFMVGSSNYEQYFDMESCDIGRAGLDLHLYCAGILAHKHL